MKTKFKEVVMKTTLRLFAVLLLLPLITGFKLSYDEPVTNEDGTPLTDFVSVQIFQSQTSGVYGSIPIAEFPASNPQGGNQMTQTLPDRPPGTYFLISKSCDSSNNCSLIPSNETTITFFDLTAPAAPSNFSATP